MCPGVRLNTANCLCILGFEALKRVVWHPDFLDVPKILETPWIKNPDNPKDTWAPYKEEIEMLRKAGQ